MYFGSGNFLTTGGWWIWGGQKTVDPSRGVQKDFNPSWGVKKNHPFWWKKSARYYRWKGGSKNFWCNLKGAWKIRTPVEGGQKNFRASAQNSTTPPTPLGSAHFLTTVGGVGNFLWTCEKFSPPPPGVWTNFRPPPLNYSNALVFFAQKGQLFFFAPPRGVKQILPPPPNPSPPWR